MANAAKIVLLADFDREYLGGRSFILGIDEAGRGALAGPVCAGAVAVSAGLYSSGAALSGLPGSQRLETALARGPGIRLRRA